MSERLDDEGGQRIRIGLVFLLSARVIAPAFDHRVEPLPLALPCRSGPAPVYNSGGCCLCNIFHLFRNYLLCICAISGYALMSSLAKGSVVLSAGVCLEHYLDTKPFGQLLALEIHILYHCLPSRSACFPHPEVAPLTVRYAESSWADPAVLDPVCSL